MSNQLTYKKCSRHIILLDNIDFFEHLDFNQIDYHNAIYESKYTQLKDSITQFLYNIRTNVDKCFLLGFSTFYVQPFTIIFNIYNYEFSPYFGFTKEETKDQILSLNMNKSLE